MTRAIGEPRDCPNLSDGLLRRRAAAGLDVMLGGGAS
jgi:hypothetical protein